MSTKEIVRDLLQKFPEDVSLHDVAQEIEFVAAIRQRLAEIDRGERIPILRPSVTGTNRCACRCAQSKRVRPFR